ncbi:Phenylalanine--tRNA ligase alpha subunit [Candidatus Hartigia pinicola]|nr:Phenylalanine--tRNA ligase alpha subunit [Candidatus Hartigia pinicola]
MQYLAELVKKAKEAIKKTQDVAMLESIRVEYLGKNSHFTQQMKMLCNLPKNERPAYGVIINKAKMEVHHALNNRKNIIQAVTINTRLLSEKLDISLPGRRMENGGLHPITRTMQRMENFFCNLGFNVETGPEIENDYHNFDALNIPPHHPARTDHDTFWFDDQRLLRTQTSAVQIRIMKEQLPPIRIITSGRVYRNDYDKTHSPMFHQTEGLIIDEHISFTHLKSILHDFLRFFFEETVQVRFRPSYFPFTEPSAEVDVMDKDGKWLEILGCGMVHPNVLRNMGIHLELYSGFAFGIGIERLTMLRYGVSDLRAFFKNDLRFLKQFK